MIWQKKPPLLFLFSVALMAFMIRVLISSVPPVLNNIQSQLGISQTLAGFTTTVPLLCFGVFAFVAPKIARQMGTNRSLLVAISLMFIGTVIRLYPNVICLFAGTFLMGVGVAIANVMLLVSIRENYPTRLKPMMSGYTALANIGAALGSALSVPVMHLLGIPWNLALGIWLLPLSILLFNWWFSTRHEDRPQMLGDASNTSYLWLLKQSTPAVLTFFICTQSALFYAQLTWIPAQLEFQGVNAVDAGAMLGLFSVLGFVGSFVGPYAVKSNFPKCGLAITLFPYLIGIWLMAIGIHLPGIILTGFGQGICFASGLTLIADLPDVKIVPRVSALAQGCGYIFGALGPVGLGALRDFSGNWNSGIITEIVLLILTIISGIFVLVLMEKDRQAFQAGKTSTSS